jgi:hypothetical protein
MRLRFPDEAIVVFEDRAERRWLRLLPHGFRHCFCVLRRGARWVVVDPLLHRLHVESLCLPADFPLARFLATAAPGRRVLVGPIGDGRPIRRPWCGKSCVIAVKRMIRLDAPATLTPRALYRTLRRLGWSEPKLLDNIPLTRLSS